MYLHAQGSWRHCHIEVFMPTGKLSSGLTVDASKLSIPVLCAIWLEIQCTIQPWKLPANLYIELDVDWVIAVRFLALFPHDQSMLIFFQLHNLSRIVREVISPLRSKFH